MYKIKDMKKHDFNPRFRWGAATSSFQIEGNIDADGKLESIWDRFCKTPGKIKDMEHAEAACDHYNRWKEDFDLLENLGVNSYRFSISWPRIVQSDLKQANQKGIEYYDKIVDDLLSRNIDPFVTLNHWDIPQKFQDKGGWVERESIKYFLDYVDIITNKLGDRVKNWITHNEPWIIAYLGYNEGTHAPGFKSLQKTLAVNHHLLLSHGLSVPIIRENSKNSQVGIALNLTPAYPASSSKADKEAAQLFDEQFNAWYLDPLYGKKYPKKIIECWKDRGELKNDFDFIQDDDFKVIAEPTDFLGVNYYSRAIIRCSKTDMHKNLPIEIVPGEKTKFDWEVFPEGLEELLIRLKKDYSPESIYITENGASYDYNVQEMGKINDTKRIEYLQSHIHACKRAVEKGVPLKGYFCWSLMDNFEWSEGFNHRFGLVHVDFDTQKRIPKHSYKWYRKFLQDEISYYKR